MSVASDGELMCMFMWNICDKKGYLIKLIGLLLIRRKKISLELWVEIAAGESEVTNPVYL